MRTSPAFVEDVFRFSDGFIARVILNGYSLAVIIRWSEEISKDK